MNSYQRVTEFSENMTQHVFKHVCYHLVDKKLHDRALNSELSLHYYVCCVLLQFSPVKEVLRVKGPSWSELVRADETEERPAVLHTDRQQQPSTGNHSENRFSRGGEVTSPVPTCFYFEARCAENRKLTGWIWSERV